VKKNIKRKQKGKKKFGGDKKWKGRRAALFLVSAGRFKGIQGVKDYRGMSLILNCIEGGGGTLGGKRRRERRRALSTHFVGGEKGGTGRCAPGGMSKGT